MDLKLNTNERRRRQRVVRDKAARLQLVTIRARVLKTLARVQRAANARALSVKLKIVLNKKEAEQDTNKKQTK